MRPSWLLLSLVVAPIVLAAPAPAADDTRPLSKAQILLFDTNHFAGIERPERLEYRFEHAAGRTGERYVDRVHLDVRPREDGAKNVWVDFLTGSRHVPFPPLMGFHGNPVLMYFLERDVEAMHAQTGGAATYFRNRIRHAFVDRAELREVELQRDGKTERATEITVVPFRGDLRIVAFPGLEEKRYRFVLSDAVPGAVYEIGVEVPGKPGEAPLLLETLTFLAEASCERSEGPCTAPAPR
jgi:hypothetical protein